MFRTAVFRSSRLAIPRTSVACRSAIARPAYYESVRFQSTEVQKDVDAEKLLRRQRLEARDNLQRDGDARLLTYEELKPKTKSPSPDAYLVDVREPNEVMQGMIPSAVNLPLSVLASALHLSPERFKEQYGFDKPRKDQEVTFYCRSGVRSASASDIAKRNGFTNIFNYKGSWLDWIRNETH